MAWDDVLFGPRQDCVGLLQAAVQPAASTGDNPQAELKRLGRGGMKCTFLLEVTAPARAAGTQALQGSAGGSLGATGGQRGGVTLQTARLSSADGHGQAGGLRTPLPQGRRTLLPNTPQCSSAVSSSPAQDELVPSEATKLCSISAAF